MGPRTGFSRTGSGYTGVGPVLSQPRGSSKSTSGTPVLRCCGNPIRVRETCRTPTQRPRDCKSLDRVRGVGDIWHYDDKSLDTSLSTTCKRIMDGRNVSTSLTLLKTLLKGFLPRIGRTPLWASSTKVWTCPLLAT